MLILSRRKREEITVFIGNTNSRLYIEVCEIDKKNNTTILEFKVKNPCPLEIKCGKQLYNPPFKLVFKRGEFITIVTALGLELVVKVDKILGGKSPVVKLAFEGPMSFKIIRSELLY